MATHELTFTLTHLRTLQRILTSPDGCLVSFLEPAQQVAAQGLEQLGWVVLHHDRYHLTQLGRECISVMLLEYDVKVPFPFRQEVQ
jgi:hypothetical protein